MSEDASFSGMAQHGVSADGLWKQSACSVSTLLTRHFSTKLRLRLSLYLLVKKGGWERNQCWEPPKSYTSSTHTPRILIYRLTPSNQGGHSDSVPRCYAQQTLNWNEKEKRKEKNRVRTENKNIKSRWVFFSELSTSWSHFLFLWGLLWQATCFIFGHCPLTFLGESV